MMLGLVIGMNEYPFIIIESPLPLRKKLEATKSYSMCDWYNIDSIRKLMAITAAMPSLLQMSCYFWVFRPFSNSSTDNLITQWSKSITRLMFKRKKKCSTISATSWSAFVQIKNVDIKRQDEMSSFLEIESFVLGQFRKLSFDFEAMTI